MSGTTLGSAKKGRWKDGVSNRVSVNHRNMYKGQISRVIEQAKASQKCSQVLEMEKTAPKKQDANTTVRNGRTWSGTCHMYALQSN